MKILIREARKEDEARILEIAKHTWDGEDYLPVVFEDWLSDGNFYVLEVEGRVAGCAKLTILPGKVAWLEGLRVHPEYQGKGLGRALHDFVMEKAEELSERGIVERIQFSTYYLNERVLKMAKKDGFKIIKRYYYVQREPWGGTPGEPSSLHSIEEMEYEEFIPFGWLFVQKVEETLPWLRKRSKVISFSGKKFMYPRHHTEPTFVPFSLSTEYLSEILPAMSYEAKTLGMDSVDVMIPEERKDSLKFLKDLGFKHWEGYKRPDVLILDKKI